MEVWERDTSETADERIRGEFVEVCGQLNVVFARLVDLARQARDAEVHAGCTLAQWLAWQTGLSAAHVRQVVALVDAHESHPSTWERFAQGGLSVDQAAQVVRVDPALDVEFAELAPLATVAQLRTLVRAARVADPAPVEPADQPAEQVSFGFDDDGRFDLRARLDADHGRVIDAALAEARDALFHAGQPRVGWVDALVEIAQRSLDTVSCPDRRERFRTMVFVDPSGHNPITFTDHHPLPGWLAAQLACDGVAQAVYRDAGLPVSVGLTQPSPPERTRRLILHRDVTCRVPWCATGRWLQIHHIVHRADHGPTDTDNLVALCAVHHRQHHRGELGISGNADHPDGLTFTDQHDRAHTRTPVNPPGQPPLTPTSPYRHPLGERLEHWAIDFTHHYHRRN